MIFFSIFDGMYIFFLTYNLHSLVNAQPFFSIVREGGEKGAVFDSSVNKQGD